MATTAITLGGLGIIFSTVEEIVRGPSFPGAIPRHAGEIIPREALLMQVWGYGAEIRTRTLDVHVRRLRKKLGGYADQYIETIFGIGYRFQPYRAPRFFQGQVSKPAIAISA